MYPFFHTAGLKSGILACVLRGAEIHPFPVFDVDAVMDYVARHRITMLPGPPTVFQSILDHPRFAEFDLSSLRLSVTGAAVVPVEVVRRMREDLRFETVVTGYGLTETTGTVSMCRHDDPPETVATTVGRPLPGVEVKVVDDEERTLPRGEPGEILVRGFNVMKEYFADPAATAQAMDAEGWLRTGDIGFVGEDGNIRITDRKKDMYICGGFNVYPAEVEGIMLRHPSVAQVAVVGVPDPRLGEVGHAVVVPRAGVEWDTEAFLGWCRESMANYKVPRTRPHGRCAAPQPERQGHEVPAARRGDRHGLSGPAASTNASSWLDVGGERRHPARPGIDERAEPAAVALGIESLAGLGPHLHAHGDAPPGCELQDQ